jgi:hypothetical protein
MRFKALLLIVLLLSWPLYSQEEATTQDEKDLQELQASQEQSKKEFDYSVENIKKNLSNIGESTSTALDTLKDKFVNEKVKKTLSDMIKENPFHKIPKEELKNRFVSGLPENYIGKWLKNSPRMTNLIIEFMHDKDALPGIAKAVLDGKRVRTFRNFLLVTFILYFVLSYFFTRNQRYFSRRLLINIGIFLSLNLTNFLFFTYLFYKEVLPLYRVIGRVLF